MIKPLRAEMRPGSATKASSVSKGKGAVTALLMAIMMAAHSFKKRTIPPMPRPPDGELQTSKAIQDWIKEAKDVVNTEGMKWLMDAAEAIELDEHTQVHSFVDPDKHSSCTELDGTDNLNITDVNIKNKLVRIFSEYGAAASKYDALKPGVDYKDDMMERDWKDIMLEIHSFNSQMRKAIKDAKVLQIYEAIDRGYHNNSHPLGGIIAWKMVLEMQSGDINNDRTANMTQMQKLVVEGPKNCLASSRY